MAKATYVRNGETANFKAEGKAIGYLDIVVLNDKKVGVALAEIPQDDYGTVGLVGAYLFPKAKSGVQFKVGDPVYFSKSSNLATATSSDVPAGICLEDAKATDAVVLVKLG